MARRVLGIDAGGTGTRGILLVDGQPAARLEDGPMNALLHGDLAERLSALIRAHRAEVVGVGLPGLRSLMDGHALSEQLSTATGARVFVRNDADAALDGAFTRGSGIIVIAGTGSMALGRRIGADGSEETARAGGHGFLLGDEGGGYWIGREAVRAALAARDGTGEPTALGEIVTSVLDRTLDAIVATVHTSPTDRGTLSALVPHVARSGDPVAERILGDAADALVRLADAVRRRLGAPDLPVAPVGGVFRVPQVLHRFRARTHAVDPADSPEVGAARMALRLSAASRHRDAPSAPSA
jgi:glucosamine kinase